MFDNLQVIPGEAFTATGNVIEKVIDKISNAVGWIATPKANKEYRLEAEKYLIENIKNDENMPIFAKASCISNARKLIKEYQNQHDILSQALNFIDNNAEPERVDNDWLSYFFDQGKNISRDDMKVIWGKILAKEINTPGTISKSLIHILSVIDYEDASSFLKVANFTVLIGDEYCAVIFADKIDEFYSKHGLTLGELINLEDTGLIQQSVTTYNFTLDEGEKVVYFDTELDLKGAKKICIGNTLLTKSGKELMSIITEKSKIMEFERFLQDIMTKDWQDVISEILDGKF